MSLEKLVAMCVLVGALYGITALLLGNVHAERELTNRACIARGRADCFRGWP